MKEEVRLPKNGKEGLLYGIIICTITVIIMTTMNISLQFKRLDGEVALLILKAIPIILIIAMLLESLIIGRIADRLVEKFSEPTDGFNAKILFNILFCVLGMSACMTIFGDMMGNGISLASFTRFPSHWPKNFCVALWCEILLAQPLARFAMRKLHSHQEDNATKYVKDLG